MLRAGETLAGYRIEHVLGSGGMGTVYEATQVSLQRTVALKVLAAHLSDDETFRERFRREAMLQAALEHPHIVTVYEAGESDEGLFIATRLVRGTDLKELIEAGLPAPRALDVLAQVASALDAAHAAGLVHRDVKPRNILVDDSGVAYLADFGLIRTASGPELTHSGAYVGTLDYVSPEQIRGEAVTARSDLYAFAVVLYECLSGEVPFARDTEAALLYAHLEEPPPRLSERRAELPPALDDILDRGLAKEPADRFESASALIAAAQDALAQSDVDDLPMPVATDAPPQSGETIVERALPRPAPVVALEEPQRFRTEWALGALVGAVAIALAAFGLGRLANGEAADAPPGVVVGGPLAFSFPADEWRPSQDPPEIAGLALDDPVVLTSVDEEAGTLAAGLSEAARGPRLLPPSFVALLERTPRREAVRLGTLTGFRYRNLLQRRIHGEFTVYAVPTTTGVATIVCLAAGDKATETLARCEAVATTLTLRGAEALPLGTSERYATAVNTALTALDEQRGDGRRALRAARTPLAQARAAEGVAGAFGAAAAALERARPGPVERNVHEALVASLRRTADAYEELARAARARRRGAYDEAAGAVGRAEEAIDASLNALGRLGYRVSRR
jgi:hypothetical protein